VREISLHILDILQNSVEAGASRVDLTIDEDLQADRLTIAVKDNGRGMDAAQVARVTDPFYTTRTTRHVGLGLPLLAGAADRCGGSLKIESVPGAGTLVTTVFQHSHIDRAPLGNIQGTLMAFILGHDAQGGPELSYRHRVGNVQFELNTAELRTELDGIPLSHPQVRGWLEGFIAEGEAEVFEGLTSGHAVADRKVGGTRNAEDQVD
jgi:anti-sigma regulatory factor (Ser/Thr protein kinase)